MELGNVIKPYSSNHQKIGYPILCSSTDSRRKTQEQKFEGCEGNESKMPALPIVLLTHNSY